MGKSEMKITGLKTYIVDSSAEPRSFTGFRSAPQWVFVRVHTDEGLAGLGEGSVTSKATTVAAAIMELERMLVGHDPTQIERLWQRMYRIPRWRGGPVLNSAISAIEIALWDILGQLLGVPIYRLLGGACRDRVRMYAHCGGATPEQAAENALRLKERGYTALKTGSIHVENDTVRPASGLAHGAAKIRAMREAVGPDFDIAIDAHGQLTPVMALDFAERVWEYRPLFLEEATQPEDLDALAWLSARVKVPLATGERLFTKYGFADLCARHLVSVVQPDVVHCGGILEMKKIATIAEAHFIDCAPHNPQSWVSTFASLHVDACTPNCTIQEWIQGPPWQAELFETEFAVQDGFAFPPDRPGLGLGFNDAEAAKHPYAPDFRPEWHWEDGMITDW
jgi:galactonate dehydratase